MRLGSPFCGSSAAGDGGAGQGGWGEVNRVVLGERACAARRSRPVVSECDRTPPAASDKPGSAAGGRGGKPRWGPGGRTPSWRTTATRARGCVVAPAPTVPPGQRRGLRTRRCPGVCSDAESGVDEVVEPRSGGAEALAAQSISLDCCRAESQRHWETDGGCLSDSREHSMESMTYEMTEPLSEAQLESTMVDTGPTETA